MTVKDKHLKTQAKRVVDRARSRIGTAAWEMLGTELQQALLAQQMMSEVLTAAACNPDNAQLQTLTTIYALVQESEKS